MKGLEYENQCDMENEESNMIWRLLDQLDPSHQLKIRKVSDKFNPFEVGIGLNFSQFCQIWTREKKSIVKYK